MTPGTKRGPGTRGVLVAVYGARWSGAAAGRSAAVASALAHAIAELGGVVGLVELDPRALRGNAHRARRAGPAPPAIHDDAAPSARNGGRATARADHSPRRLSAEPEAWLGRRDDGVWVMAGPGRPRSPGLPDAKSVASVLDALRDAVPMGVVDVERQVNERTLAALDAADRVLLVTNGSVASLRGTQRMLRLCRRLNYADEKLCIVAMPAVTMGSLDAAEIAAALRRSVYWTIPDSAGGESYQGLADRLVAELRANTGA